MQYFDIPEKEFEELSNTELDKLDLSVRLYNALRRNDCRTLADLAYLSVEEIQKMRFMPKRALETIQEKLAEQNITLMTQAEKEHILGETDNPVVLKRQIQILESREKLHQKEISGYRRARDVEWEKVQANRKRSLNEARGIVRTSPYPIARLLETMYFGRSAKEGCSFCDIFELWDEYGCFVETDSQEGRELTHSCEECIEKFLADYYWGKRMAAKLAAERGEAPQMIRMSSNWQGGLTGCCPVCGKYSDYHKDVNYCVRCGTYLNWDEVNWDEETIEKLDWCMDDDDDGDEE